MKLLMTFVFLFCIGCTPLHTMIETIPNVEFDTFYSHRGGNVTSATVSAEDAVKEGDNIIIGEVEVTLDYGPFFNYYMKMTGFTRMVEELKEKVE